MRLIYAEDIVGQVRPIELHDEQYAILGRDVKMLIRAVVDNTRTANVTPCDVCRHNPPSSGDGKPCSMCPAESVIE